MVYNIYLIRHAKTEANLQRRFMGITDEPLCPAGIVELRQRIDSGYYPQAEFVFTSPLQRCQQTRELIYGTVPHLTIPELGECNFGLFENKTNEELRDIKEYQEWLAGGETNFPQGESFAEFCIRSGKGFEKAVEQIIKDKILNSAFIIHGGTIMAILTQYAPEVKEFYAWKAENGSGYRLEIEEELWFREKKIKSITAL